MSRLSFWKCRTRLLESNKKMKKIIKLIDDHFIKFAVPARKHSAGGDSPVNAAPAFISATQAMQMLESALGYLAAADPTQLPTDIQARLMQTLERSDAVSTAARASVLAAFTAAQGHCEDGDYSPRSWLIHRTRVTKGTAAGHIAWVRRARSHPRIVAALAAGEMTESYARTVCQWTDKLPGQCRGAADEILAGAAGKGMDLRDLAALAAEIQSRAAPPPGPDDPDPAFEDRAVRLETTFGGAGVLSASLTPECTALVGHGPGGAVRAAGRGGHPHP